jgi:hypothetical protein
LSAASRARDFDGLVLVAGPAFLGRLRAALPKFARAPAVQAVRTGGAKSAQLIRINSAAV